MTSLMHFREATRRAIIIPFGAQEVSAENAPRCTLWAARPEKRGVDFRSD
jgi:hypothetical protein